MNIQEIEKFYVQLPQVSALAKLLGKSSEKRIFLEGLLGSSAPMMFASLASKCQTQMLFVLQDAEEAGYFYHDLTQLMGTDQVLFFPSSYRRAVKYAQRDAASEILRTEVLTRLTSVRYVVTYPEALAELVVSKKNLDSRTLSLEKDQTIAVSDIEKTLREFGFHEVDYVYEPGQFAVRGSILDVYSYSCEYPYRIDFFGDDIDSIRTFEVEDQLSKDQRTQVEIVPELVGTEDKVPFLSFLPKETLIVTKDYYYVFRSAWTDPKKEPMIHIFPYWDFNKGQIIDVRVCSNEDSVELFLNGTSLGKQTLTHAPGSGDHILADYRVPYEDGCLEAVAYDRDGNITARDVACSFGESASVQVDVSSESMRAGSDDLIFAEISVLDDDGNPVRNACNRMKVDVTGAGRLVGLDNGDSTDEDSYKAVSRRLFNGKLLAVIAPSDKEGEVSLKVTSEGLMDCEVKLQCSRAEEAVLSPFDKGAERFLERNEKHKTLLGADEEIPVRKIVISADDRELSPEKKEITVRAGILPENATDRDIIYSAVSDKGVPVNFVKLTPGEGEVKIEALGDGDFRLRCMSRSGSRSIRVISELEFSVKGVGPAFLDPYGFIYGSAYTYSEGEIGAGNEMGFASARNARSLVGFDNIDFGPIGSDEITIPVFTLNGDAYPFRVYDGIPGNGGNLIGEFVYQKPSIWNTYQEDTWKFDKVLKGICSLYFEFSDKMHIKISRDLILRSMKRHSSVLMLPLRMRYMEMTLR